MGKNKENDIFSSKFQVYFSFFSVIFLLFICIPLIFVSNEDPRVTGMAYPDTGELVLNLLTLISDQFFYDQTIPGKSALYGWAHTSLIFWQYAFIQWIGIDKNEFYSIYAFVARLNGVIISCLVAFLFPKVFVS